MSLWTSTLEAFRNQVSANAPVPSCGAAACVCASFGLALLQMVMRNANEKKPSPALEAMVVEIEGLTAVLAAHADNDVRTFDAYVTETIEGTNDHSEQATMDITLGALAGARSCLAGLEMAERARDHAVPHMLNDVTAAALIMHASLSALLLNAKQDAGQLDETRSKLDLDEVIDQLRVKGDEILQRLRS